MSFLVFDENPLFLKDLLIGAIRGVKFHSHWRVNIGGGRVKLAMRSPDRASVFPSNKFVIFQSFGRKNGKTPI